MEGVGEKIAEVYAANAGEAERHPKSRFDPWRRGGEHRRLTLQNCSSTQ
jgi:hypothetical protein